MSLGNEFQRQVIAAHVSQRLAGPARAILGYQELLFEQARELGLNHVDADLERIGAAARQLNGLIDGLLDGKACSPEGKEPEAEARLRHDLRTPLNAIIGYSEMILEEVADSPLKEDLNVILAAAAELLKQVDSLAGLWRGEAIEALQPAEQTTIDAAALERILFKARHETFPDLAGKILIVDDVASNRDLLSRRLRRDGHRVFTADCGLSALARLAKDEFDLILLDILMPDMNGIEILSRLKSESRWRHVPVIMISGLSEVAAVARCIEAGADDYLTKPFNATLLRARINSALEKKRWLDREHRYLQQIETEKRRVDALIHAILPDQIVARLQGGEAIIADRFDAVSILFADIVGFSPIATRLPPSELVRRLDGLFSKFDLLTEQHRVEKIKTIGDAYMAACGIPEPAADHADRIVALGRSMLNALDAMPPDSDRFRIRIGIHSGPVVAGLIGRHRFVYDVWGETVNIASRLESQGVADHIQFSEATMRALSGSWTFEPRCGLELRGIGTVKTYLMR
ncbi:class 3 adenylate cyclase/CheY-like chemotaxis protein [Sinorhizobium kostiense]|uniref:histidine kinase n=1 Tax=Sinorhizobium kostiense TaxID=76747 RepID=A0ABS4QTJ8_9HYPH|nr:adenylate/guanylate cyclase domain-containing protein [Sinorhizobium kostiense]MBP2233977.1 class 3 adenylate cyclase/CheY-like chemotaxis protein [Sinorhizobium kostiense]